MIENKINNNELTVENFQMQLDGISTVEYNCPQCESLNFSIQKPENISNKRWNKIIKEIIKMIT